MVDEDSISTLHHANRVVDLFTAMLAGPLDSVVVLRHS